MNLLVLQRGSLSSEKFVISRSVFNRVLEPLSYIAERLDTKLKIDVKSVEEALDLQDYPYDFAIFCKHSTLNSVELLRKLKGEGVKIINDFDDLIFKPTVGSIVSNHPDKKMDAVAIHLTESDHVIFSNYFIQQVSQRYYKIPSSSIIRTCFNTDKYYREEYRPEHEGVLFTNGDMIKIDHFREDFYKVFNEFLRANTDLSFDVFGDTQSYLEAIDSYNFLGSLPWDEHKYYMMKNQYKFAIVPLGAEEESTQHSDFSVCKTPIKFYEYGAMMIPAIYSDAYIYRKVVENGVTGILVRNDYKSWKDALSEMNNNSDLRRKIAKNSFSSVHENHHIKFASRLWLELFESLIAPN